MEEMLLPPNGKDYFTVNATAFISNVDVNVITRLYQPIIGYKAAIVYLTLVNYSIDNVSELIAHEDLFDIMQISARDFLYARRTLEGASLLKTYESYEKEIKKFTYVIYPPKSPKDFFNDVLFRGLLTRNIGEKNTLKLSQPYKLNIDLNNSKNVSAKFLEIFQPNLDDGTFKVNINENLIDNKSLKVDTNFSYEDFFTQLRLSYNILDKAFSKKELDEIERLSTLYGLDMITVSDIVSQCFDATQKVGSKIDLNTFKERAINEAKYSTIVRKTKQNKTYLKMSGKTVLANEIDLMERLSPKSFLQNRQDGMAPVTSDLKLFDWLSSECRLANGVINALISYCLKNCDNRLDRNYVEKVASSLKREKVTTALDALNYLENRTGKVSKTKVNKKVVDNKKEDEEFDLDEYNALLESVTKKK